MESADTTNEMKKIDVDVEPDKGGGVQEDGSTSGADTTAVVVFDVEDKSDEILPDKLSIEEGKVDEVQVAKDVGSLKRKSCEAMDDESAVNGDDEAKKAKTGVDAPVSDVDANTCISASTAVSTENETNPKQADANLKDQVHIGLRTMNKADIVVIDVDDESNDGEGIESMLTQPEPQQPQSKENGTVDTHKEEQEKQMEVNKEVPEKQIEMDKEELEKMKELNKEETQKGKVCDLGSQSAGKVRADVTAVNPSHWSEDKMHFVNEIQLLRARVERMVERQMLLEDFALVEYAARFRTFFHAREKLLEMGKKRWNANPSNVLAPGSSHLIEILRVINEKADGEIEELDVTEDDILKIEENLKKLKNRLSDSSSRGRNSGTVDLNSSVSSNSSFPPTLPHKFTSDNQPVYDSGTPKGVLPNPLYAGKGQTGNKNNSSPTAGGSGTGRKRARQKTKIICEVCQLSMNVPFYRKQHIHQHVGIVYACPVCKGKKGNSQRDVNKCLRENHGTVPGEGVSEALRYIQEDGGSFRLITCKEQLEEEVKIFLANFNALPAEEREKIKQKFLADQDRSPEKKDESKTPEKNERNESDLQAEETSAKAPTSGNAVGGGSSEDIEIVEIFASKPVVNVEDEKTDNNAPSSTTTAGGGGITRNWDLVRKDMDTKLKQHGIGLFRESPPSGTKVGKPFPVPTVAVSSTTNNADSPSPVLPTLPGGSASSSSSSSRKNPRRNRGRKRAGLSPIRPTGSANKSPPLRQQSQRYFQTPTPQSNRSGLSMASRSILGRDLPKSRPNNFINATQAFDDFDSVGPIRPTISSFGGRASPYENTGGMGRGRGSSGGRIERGISSFVGSGRGLNNSSSTPAASSRRLVPMPSSASMKPIDSFEPQSRYSNPSSSGGRLVATNARNMFGSEERMKLDASCLGDNRRGGNAAGGVGGLRRFDYSSGVGQSDSYDDDSQSPSLLSAPRPLFPDLDFGLSSGLTDTYGNNDGMASERNSSFFSPARRGGGSQSGVIGSGIGSGGYSNNASNMSFEERYASNARAEAMDPILRNPRFSASTNYTMSGRPAQYGYFTSPGSGGGGGGGGAGGGLGAGGAGGGSNLKYSQAQGQFGSYAEYAQSVLNTQNRYR